MVFWVRRSSSEIAGLGPDPNLLRFAKQHVAAQWVHPLIGSSVFSLSAEAGVVLPWGPDWQTKPTYISERQAPNFSFFCSQGYGRLVLLTGTLLCLIKKRCTSGCLSHCSSAAEVECICCFRYFLGGVHGNLRGFHFKGAGPVDTRQGREVRSLCSYLCVAILRTHSFFTIILLPHGCGALVEGCHITVLAHARFAGSQHVAHLF